MYLDFHLNTALNEMLRVNPVIWWHQLRGFQRTKIIHLLRHFCHVQRAFANQI